MLVEHLFQRDSPAENDKYRFLSMDSIFFMITIHSNTNFGCSDESFRDSFANICTREARYDLDPVISFCLHNCWDTLSSWRRYSRISCYLLPIEEHYESYYFSTVFLYIFDWLAKCCSSRDDIIEEDTAFSRYVHAESISTLAVIFDFFAMRWEPDTHTSSLIVFLWDYCSEGDTLICWTI